MEIHDLVKRFAGHSGVSAMRHVWDDESVRTIHLKGLSASAAPMLFSALAAAEKPDKTIHARVGAIITPAARDA